MSMPFERLATEVMELGQEERAQMLEKLLKSSSEAAEIEQCWVQEALRREVAVAEGRSTLVSGADAVARIRARFA